LTLTKHWLDKFDWPETLLTGHPLAIAHRGASDHAPENTLKAFQIAAELCAEMWELDLHLSKDGVCVVSHDDNLMRVAGQDIRISQCTWAQISELSLLEGQHIPCLEEVIDLAKKTGCGLYIEIKSDGAGPAAWRQLQQAKFKFACLGAFEVKWIAELRNSGCEYPLAILVPPDVDPLQHSAQVRVDIVHICWRNAVSCPDKLLTDALMNDLRGHQIVLWDEDRMAVLQGLWVKPVMGICSNRPELLKPYRPDPANPVDIVCHRGANNLAPENTLEAAKICVDQRFQYVEIDVRTTSDDGLVVLHDASLARTTNGRGRVCDHTLSDIRSLDAGSWFRDGAAGVKVPGLGDFLEQAHGQAGVYVEIKQAQAEDVLEVVSAYDMLKSCFFWSSDIKLLHWLRERSPDIILMAPRRKFTSVAKAIAAYGAQIIEFDAELDNLAEIKQCQALGVRSMIYSRRSDWDELASYAELKPNMVNLDHPGRFKILVSYPQVRQHFQAMTKADTL